jgi:hypothetical protein
MEARACCALDAAFIRIPFWSLDACVSQMAQVEPRKILEMRKRFLEEKFGSGQKAEAEIQKLLASLLQVRLSLGPQHQNLKSAIFIRRRSCRWRLAG